ncbi:hypothetical protein [Microbispora sp. KK1-11]|uniref:hypothetical protein n=1 Tax=Microbispora sp. KK1-11 TaxID=2053005 RepID=UPI00115BF539|nr:hypothetical protein [Microbispora sp. KK1-11]TQS23083.1 hypothetical protein FLW16_37180 [Microbispora sp. KK1-11]
MIVWLNGTFGVGKTTTAAELVRLIPGAHFFDPEQVGVMLRHATGLPLHHLTAYQDALPWLSREAQVVDTTSISPTEVAAHIVATVTPDPA